LSDPADRLRGFEAGADGFLTKPIADDVLFARIRSTIRGRQKR
jgi:two-component system, cell cycle response regulator